MILWGPFLPAGVSTALPHLSLHGPGDTVPPSAAPCLSLLPSLALLGRVKGGSSPPCARLPLGLSLPVTGTISCVKFSSFPPFFLEEFPASLSC